MNFFNISENLQKLDLDARALIAKETAARDEITRYNQHKVLRAFINNKVSEAHFAASTGYGYGDRGREVIEAVFAEITGAQSALFRHNFVSGTHALTVALFGVLRPNDKMLILTGRPYDTLIGVLGCDQKTDGSLADFGIITEQIDLDQNGKPQYDLIAKKIKDGGYKAAYIQRSRGYTMRPSLCIDEIEKLTNTIKSADPNTAI